MRNIADNEGGANIVRSDLKKAYLLNIIKLAGIALIAVGAYYLIVKIVGSNPFDTVFETFGISGANILAVCGFLAMAYLLVTSLKTARETGALIFHGDSVEFSGKTYPKENLAKVQFTENALLRTGDIKIELSGLEETQIEIKFVPKAQEMSARINKWLRGSISAHEINPEAEQEPKEEKKAKAETKAAKMPDIEPDAKLDFTGELISYIKDQLNEGQGLDQIEKSLLEEGYDPDIVEFAIRHVSKHEKITPAQKERKGPATKKEHLNKKFLVPLTGIVLLMIIVAFLMYTIGSREENKEAPKEIDIFLYEKLGARPEQYSISEGGIIYSATEKIDTQLARSKIRESQNPAIRALDLDDTVKEVTKTATNYLLTKKGGGVEQRTLVEISFTGDGTTKSIIEIIPKSAATADDIILTEDATMIDTDPTISWQVKTTSGETTTVSYAFKKKIDRLYTTTFTATQKAAAGKTVCGDGRCSQGESYYGCCADCGCLSGFRCTSLGCVAEQADKCRTDADCDDGKTATTDKCGGSPKQCSNFQTIECIGGDGYCPQMCDYTTDPDCEAPATATENTTATNETPEEAPLSTQTSPKVTELVITPTVPRRGDTMLVEVTVIDPEGKNDIVLVYGGVLDMPQGYKAEGAFKNDGSAESGDKSKDDDIYTAKITFPVEAPSGSYTMWVYARDTTGNEISVRKLFTIS